MSAAICLVRTCGRKVGSKGTPHHPLSCGATFCDAYAAGWEARVTEETFWSDSAAAARAAGPIPMYLTCPKCSERHIDVGEFATKPHHTHACQACGLTWRPAIAPTVGVAFLPGFKDATATDVERRALWAHCVSEHCVSLSPTSTIDELLAFHAHEHGGPGTIRNHPEDERYYSLAKIGRVLSEVEAERDTKTRDP